MTSPPSLSDRDRLLAWCDTETTGLNERRDSLLEVGLIVTDWTLTPRAERAWTLRFSGEVSPYIATMHGPGGSRLLRVALAHEDGRTWYKSDGLDADAVDATASAWLHEACGGVPPIFCGRNVAFDRRWLRGWLPQLHDTFHHRSFDETSLRLALESWGGVTVPKDATAQGNLHRALDDLRECLRVAARFRDWLTSQPGDPTAPRDEPRPEPRA